MSNNSSYILNAPVERTVYLTLNGAPALGIQYSAIHLQVKKPDQKYFTTVTVQSSSWSDTGSGFYTITLDSSLMDIAGTFAYILTGAGFNNTIFEQFVLMDQSLSGLQQSYFQDSPVERTLLLKLAGNPATGITPNQVHCKIKKANQINFTEKILDLNNWIELGNGYYTIKFSAIDMSRVGTFVYSLDSGTFDNFEFEEFSVLAVADITLKDKCIVTGKFVSLAGDAARQIKVYAKAAEYPASSNGRVVSGDVIFTELAYDGSFQMALLRGSTVIIEVPRAAIRHQITIPDAPTASLMDLLPPMAVSYS